MNEHIEINSKFTILDLGSFEGFSPIWDHFGELVTLVGIDPFEPEGTKLGKFNRTETTFNCIINDTVGEYDFNISRNKHASSLLKENTKVVSRYHTAYDGEILKTEKVTTKKLSDILSNNNITDIDFIKIDIEGSELTILKSIEDLVKNKCLGIYIETFFQEYHIGRPLFSEVELYLRSLGYYVYDVVPEKWGKKTNNQKYGDGQVIYCNTLFFKDPILNPNDITDIEKIKKLILLSSLWKQNDFSIELIKKYL